MLCCFNGCSSNAHDNTPKFDLNVVDAERNQLIRQWNSYSGLEKKVQLGFFKLIKQEYGHTQPDNKKVECKIPIMRHPAYKDAEHKVFWDGNCKNGYGIGLGRVIVKGINDHAELLIDLPQNGVIPREILYWYRDYTLNHTEYGFDSAEGEFKGAHERVTKTPFSLTRELAVSTIDGTYGLGEFVNSAGMFIVNSYANPLFIYRKIINEDPTYPLAFELQTLNPQKRQIIGISKAILKNGEIRTYLPNGMNVRVPYEYFNDMNIELNKVQMYVSEANNYAEKASELYEIYIHKSCNKTSSTNGIESELFRKICFYWTQFDDDITQVMNTIKSNQEHRQKLINEARIRRAAERARAEEERARAEEERKENERRMAADTQKALEDLNRTIQGIRDNYRRNTEMIMQQNQRSLDEMKFYYNLKCLTQPYCTMLP